MSPEILTEIRRALLPPASDSIWKMGLAVFLLAGLVGLAQETAYQWVARRFEPGDISFPLALAPVTQAGAAANLIGWGFMLNDEAIPLLRWLMSLLALLFLAIAAGRVLGWSPVVMAAGGIANLLELGFRGAVLDWIIIPKGATIKAISLGDVAIYIGAVWCVVAMIVICVRAVLEVVHARQDDATKNEMP